MQKMQSPVFRSYSFKKKTIKAEKLQPGYNRTEIG